MRPPNAGKTWLAAAALVALAVALAGCRDSGGSTRDGDGAAAAPRATATSAPDFSDQVLAAVDDYAAAIASGDREYVIAHLHATANHFYGAETCRSWLGAIGADPTFRIDAHDVSGPAPWTWEVYGETIATLPDAYTLNVTLTQQGVAREAEVHFTWNAERGELRGFSPCVAPPAP